MKINPLLDEIEGEQSFFFIAKARKVAEETGLRIISFGIGQPDFDTPAHVKEVAKKALDEGFTGYTETAGIPELREAIVDYLNSRYNSSVSPDNILVATGGKTAIFLAMVGVVMKGSKVIIPEPSYYAYAQVAKMLDAKPVYAPLKWKGEKGFEIDMASILNAMDKNTSAIILNNPSNPTGALFSRDQVRKLFEVAREYDATIIADEVYDNFVYDGEFYSVTSIPEWMENAILVQSFSKTFSMTGWRLGYIAGRKDLVKKLLSIAVTVYSCAPSFVQKAGVAALRGSWEPVERMVREFDERRKIMYKLLKEIKGVEPFLPGGAFYMFPRVKKLLDMLGMDVDEFTDKLLREKGVLVLPGTSFPDKTGRDFIRLSYASSKDDIVEGLNRFKEFVDEKIG